MTLLFVNQSIIVFVLFLSACRWKRREVCERRCFQELRFTGMERRHWRVKIYVSEANSQFIPTLRAIPRSHTEERIFIVDSVDVRFMERDAVDRCIERRFWCSCGRA